MPSSTSMAFSRSQNAQLVDEDYDRLGSSRDAATWTAGLALRQDSP